MGMMINLVSIQDEKMGMVIDFGGCEGYKEMRASIQKISQVRYDSVESGTTRSSRIRLDADRDESDTRYNLYLNSALNRLDSDDSTDIPS